MMMMMMMVHAGQTTAIIDELLTNGTRKHLLRLYAVHQYDIWHSVFKVRVPSFLLASDQCQSTEVCSKTTTKHRSPTSLQGPGGAWNPTDALGECDCVKAICSLSRLRRLND